MKALVLTALLVQGSGTRVAVDRDAYLRTLNPIIHDLGELARDDDPCRRDGRCLRDRLVAMQKALQALKSDLENAPQVAPGGPPPPPPPPPPPVRRPQPMSDTEFSQLLQAINNVSMSDEKVAVVRDAAQLGWFSVDQVIQVMNAISFGKQKVDAAATMYPRTIDRQNWFKVYGALAFSADKEALRRRVGSR